jgi:hypothetical protein
VKNVLQTIMSKKQDRTKENAVSSSSSSSRMQDSLEDTDLINATRGILSTLDPGLSSSSHHVA